MTFTRFPEPAYAPERGEGWLTEGGEIAKVARLLGVELMPWQRFVVDRATEYRIDPDTGDRVYRYSRVLVTVPRQSGKTTLLGPVQIHRIMTRENIKAFFTAQTGQAAGRRIQDLIALVVKSPLTAVLTPRYQAGSEGVSAPNGSRLSRFSPTEDSIHGETPHLVGIDEIWKFTAAKGEALTGGISPAQITLHGRAQLWMISTMGTSQSGFMNALVDEGRAAETPGLAYFEWSMPEGLDPLEPSSWWAFHPALGNTITEEALVEEREKMRNTPGEWLRAYCNRLTTATDPLIPDEDWKALAVDMTRPPAFALSYEVAPDNALSAVVATWRDPDGRPRIRCMHQAPGTSWLPDYIADVRDHLAPVVIAADDGGPARRITAQLRADGVEILTPTFPQRGAADLELIAAARDEKTLGHDGSAPFAQGIACAVTRTTNGVSIINRDQSTGPVAAPIAASVGLWAWDYQPAPTEPQIF